MKRSKEEVFAISMGLAACVLALVVAFATVQFKKAQERTKIAAATAPPPPPQRMVLVSPNVDIEGTKVSVIRDNATGNEYILVSGFNAGYAIVKVDREKKNEPVHP